MPITFNNRLSSPGVQISEVDLTQRAVTKIGTTVFACGFAPQGPTDEIIQVSSKSEFADIYGAPTNAAERYFYHTVSQLFNSPVNVLVNRLPYGAATGSGFSQAFYSALVYPVSSIGIDNSGNTYGSSNLASTSAYSVSSYFLGTPYLVNLPLSAYQALQDGKNITWQSTATDLSNLLNWNTSGINLNDLGAAGLIILNEAQIANNNRFEGYYVALVDNTNFNPATPFDDVAGVKGLATVQTAADLNTATGAVDIPSQRLNFQLNLPVGTIPTGSSVSEVIEAIPSYNLNSRAFDDTLTLGVFKLRQSTFSPDAIKLDYVYQEGYIGSLDFNRQINSQQGGAPISFYLPTVVEASPNVRMLVNPFISGQPTSTNTAYRTTTWLDLSGSPTTKVRVATNSLVNLGTTLSLSASEYLSMVGATSANVNYVANTSGLGSLSGQLWPLGVFTPTQIANKDVGSIPSKLDRVFDRLSNIDLYDIDLIVDGGISTIFTTTQLLGTSYFDDTISMDSYVSSIRSAKATTDVLAGNSTAAALLADWNTVFSAFSNFAQNIRKDCLFIADAYRNIFVDGPNTKTVSESGYNFSQYIFSPMRHLLYNANTSYGTIYGNWAQVYDNFSNKNVWIPFSGVAGQIMGNSDAIAKPWAAPAGFQRGLVSTVNDIAFYPNQAQRDQLYPIAVNPVTFFPNEGFVVMGQKTLLHRPSAFDRINVRRLFLVLEKQTRATAKYFVFQPNTLFTRTQLVTVIDPIFLDAKNTEGCYDYLIVCDERNNTSDIIDQNELVTDIYIKPTRTAEFILVNFVATRTSQNFQEITG